MRKPLLPGLLLVLAAVLTVFVSAALDLKLEPVVLLGLALGGVLALVPDRSALLRVAGFAVGLVLAWLGYVLRAAVLPDSAGGRAVAVGVVLALAVAIAAIAADRLPLWSLLLGAAGMAGAYEYPYSAAPPEMATTSVSTVTALLFATAVGFLATGSVAPASEDRPARAHRSRPSRDLETNASFDDMMEKSK
jgi:hypothetical protein